MERAIVTLSLNPAIDVTLYLPGLTAGEEYLAVPEQREAGGKGANVSRCLARRSIPHQSVMVLGEQNASRFLAALEEEGVSCQPVLVPGSIRENLTLAVPGQPVTHITRQGFVLQEGELERVESQLLPLLGPERLLVIGGKLPAGVTGEQMVIFCRKMQATGARLVLDTSSLTAQELGEIGPWLIKPNWEELSTLAGHPLQDVWQALEAAKALHRKIPRMLVSLGQEGLIWLGEGEMLRLTVPTVEVKSPVGAGDSLLAEFLAAHWWEERILEESLCRAAAAGTASCLRYGTMPPDPADLARLLPDVSIAARLPIL